MAVFDDKLHVDLPHKRNLYHLIKVCAPVTIVTQPSEKRSFNYLFSQHGKNSHFSMARREKMLFTTRSLRQPILRLHKDG